jgi:putative acetyltransferase
MEKIEIRRESPRDVTAIHELTRQAFRDMPFAGGDEQEVIDRLRSSGCLVLSLVAVIEQKVVGQVTFSNATVADGTSPWFALGPVAVAPHLQAMGIGSALINRGLAEIKDLSALGCILTGNPNYYQRFGFVLAPRNVPANEPPEYFMLKLFTPRQPSGAFEFNKAFYGGQDGMPRWSGW